MGAFTEFLLEDGQVVSLLPAHGVAAGYVEIGIEPREDGIAVEVFVPRDASWAEKTNVIAQDASSRAGCIRQWSSRCRVASTDAGQRSAYTFRRARHCPIGPRMAEALEFIRTHPGVCKADVFRETGARRSNDGTDPIDRLLWRRLIYDLGPRHRYVLYAWQEQEPETDGLWRPAAHP